MLQCRAIEVWRPVVGFEGAYEVSNCGGVRSLDRVVFQRSGCALRLRGKLLSPGVHPKGHRYVGLGKGVHQYVHILVLEAFVGPRPEGLIGLHADDNQANNRVSNLRWGTYSDNNRDAVRNGTHHWAGRVTCPRGHELVEPNLQASQLPRRGCKACARGYADTVGGGRTPESLQHAADRQYERIMSGA